MEQQIKKTLLHAWHLAHGGNRALPERYEMPLRYSSGVKNGQVAFINHPWPFALPYNDAQTLS